MSDASPGFLDKERIIAGPGFNRWLVPPAALAIHLCIGMAYGFSVFWLPLSKALGLGSIIGYLAAGIAIGPWGLKFVTDAQAIARRLNHNEVDTWHLLSALLAQESGLVPGLIDKLGPTAANLLGFNEQKRSVDVNGVTAIMWDRNAPVELTAGKVLTVRSHQAPSLNLPGYTLIGTQVEKDLAVDTWQKAG